MSKIREKVEESIEETQIEGYKAECPECKKHFGPYQSRAQLKENMLMHMKARHGSEIYGSGKYKKIIKEE